MVSDEKIADDSESSIVAINIRANNTKRGSMVTVYILLEATGEFTVEYMLREGEQINDEPQLCERGL